MSNSKSLGENGGLKGNTKRGIAPDFQSLPLPGMARWFFLISLVAAVCLLEIGSYVAAEWISPSSQPGGKDSAKPSWATLGRLGHELLAHADVQLSSAPGVADPFTRAWPNSIAICAMMKDERAEDVKEFIEYHRWIGVDSFFIRENGDECKIRDELKPYEDAGILDFALLPGPKHPTQTNWYNSCSRLAAKRHSWVAFIDLDEFIIVLKRNRSATGRGSLKAVLKNSFRYTAAVSMQWVLFGSGGHKDPPDSQLEGFDRCTGVLSKQMKCLGNSFWFHYTNTFRPTHVHQCNFRFGAIAVMGNAEPLNMWRVNMQPGIASTGPYGASYAGHLSDNEHRHFTNITSDYQIALFHYVTRSQNDFIERKINRRSGVYATTYAKLQASAKPDTDVDTLYKQFEHEYGFDGKHSICEQGAPIARAMQSAKAAGEWSPLPTHGGLLRQGSPGRGLLEKQPQKAGIQLW